MKDQAQRLREIIEDMKRKQSKNNESYSENITVNTTKTTNLARVITVTSGKGGVGKSNIAVNMSISLCSMGYKVALIDADLGLANVDVLMGISPEFSLADILHNNKSIMEILSEGPCGVKFISGGSGVEELVKLNKEQLEKFISEIGILDSYFDIIIIDTGAGLSDSVLSFTMASDEIIVVTTPDPTAITDAYALIKVISSRNMNKDIKVIVNRAENVNEANNVLDKLVLVTDKFLSMKIVPLGFILYDDNVIKAVKSQSPFITSNPNSTASRNIRSITMNMVNNKDYMKDASDSSGMKGFINQLYNFFRN